MKLLDKFWPQVLEAVDSWGNGNVSVNLPLGAKISLEVCWEFRCVSIRRFFRPKADPTKLLPGFSGIGLKFEEFYRLGEFWGEVRDIVRFAEAKCCQFDVASEHKNCDICHN